MSEYIITDEQLKTAVEAYVEHELSLPMTDVFISGDKLSEIVRCRDCKLCDELYGRMLCRRDMSCDEIALDVEPDGFCAWGERRDA